MTYRLLYVTNGLSKLNMKILSYIGKGLQYFYFMLVYTYYLRCSNQYAFFAERERMR